MFKITAAMSMWIKSVFVITYSLIKHEFLSVPSQVSLLTRVYNSFVAANNLKRSILSNTAVGNSNSYLTSGRFPVDEAQKHTVSLANTISDLIFTLPPLSMSMSIKYLYSANSRRSNLRHWRRASLFCTVSQTGY